MHPAIEAIAATPIIRQANLMARERISTFLPLADVSITRRLDPAVADRSDPDASEIPRLLGSAAQRRRYGCLGTPERICSSPDRTATLRCPSPPRLITPAGILVKASSAKSHPDASESSRRTLAFTTRLLKTALLAVRFGRDRLWRPISRRTQVGSHPRCGRCRLLAPDGSR